MSLLAISDLTAVTDNSSTGMSLTTRLVEIFSIPAIVASCAAF
jgi:hypothetical protein